MKTRRVGKEMSEFNELYSALIFWQKKYEKFNCQISLNPADFAYESLPDSYPTKCNEFGQRFSCTVSYYRYRPFSRGCHLRCKQTSFDNTLYNVGIYLTPLRLLRTTSRLVSVDLPKRFLLGLVKVPWWLNHCCWASQPIPTWRLICSFARTALSWFGPR
jgi:hypothetical protein